MPCPPHEAIPRTLIEGAIINYLTILRIKMNN